MAHGDITHIDIPVSDLDRAKHFYGLLFGWQIAAPPGFEDYPMWQAPNKISGGGLAPAARTSASRAVTWRWTRSRPRCRSPRARAPQS
ncbi:hypothetical protein GCM10025876_15040 [Demequina litorisediminis]|uniref:Glyoxalase/Bleomycin resistance-like N-terminal domain-containing protein n=1 Tax=Demequina litorisediminis TaxID=1849022 RepID=A0ABQ6IC36_9MICO|nr:hypothetical protein GCM10025876_15040 [Demequina litorisediminis]